MTARLAPVLAAMSLVGCAIERGKAWDRPAPPASRAEPGAVSFVLLGEVGYPGRTAAIVAAEVERTVAARTAAGVPVVLLWLGDVLGDECRPAVALARPGVAELAAVARKHEAASFAVLGAQEWRCGAPTLHLQAGPGARPWRMPAANYVVRVARDGKTDVVSTCTDAMCTVEPATDAALVDLVLVDTAAWLAAPPRLLTAAETSLTQQQALLAALEAAPQTDVPRVLVTHHPIETAGPHGQGGLWPDSAYALHSEPLRRAIDRGMFAGAVSGHDRSLSATADIFDAVKRSSRAWLAHPLFQVVSGGLAHPDGAPAGGRRGWVYYQGQALKPDLLSNRAGFAELLVRPDGYVAELHQRKLGRWRAARLQISRDRPPHPAETPSPVMDPCLYCDPLTPRQ